MIYMPSYGMLSVRAVTANGALPVEGASVIVTERDGNKNRLIAYRETDRSGLSEDIKVETPDIELSQSPGNKTGYSICDIEVYATGFYTIIIKNTQVFPDNTSIQTVSMPPLPENADINKRTLTYSVSPQDL